MATAATSIAVSAMGGLNNNENNPLGVGGVARGGGSSGAATLAGLLFASSTQPASALLGGLSVQPSAHRTGAAPYCAFFKEVLSSLLGDRGDTDD